MNNRSQRGNILFIILIAVVLFGALSYAVSNSMRGSGKEASGEKIDVAIAAMQQYALSLESAINRMLLVNELKPEDLLFDPIDDSSLMPGGLPGGLPDSDQKRFVYAPLGGGMRQIQSFFGIRALETGSITTSADNEVKGIGTSASGSTPTQATRDIMLLVSNLSESVCARINQKIGMGATIPTLNDIDVEEDTPSMSAGPGIPTTGGAGGVITGPTLDGKPQGCFLDGSGGGFGYVYYYVLVAR